MKSRRRILKVFAVLGLLGLWMTPFMSCTKDNPAAPPADIVEKKAPSYTFTGFVIDGYTGRAISGAKVVYYDAEGMAVAFTSAADGGFTVPEIPYGNRSFFFSYTPADTVTGTRYTTAVVTVQGNNWDNFAFLGLGADSAMQPDSILGGIRSVAGPVKLYPLSGSLSGTVKAQLHALAPLSSVRGAVVKVTLDSVKDNQNVNAAVIGANVEVGPNSFQALTDSNGVFTLTGLPVSSAPGEKVTVRIISVTVNGIDWQMAGTGLQVELVPGQSVPIGSIVMTPIPVTPLVELETNFRTLVVDPQHVFEITYSDVLDTVSYAVLSYVDVAGLRRNVPVSRTVSGARLTVTPDLSLINGQAYRLNTYVYGAKGQSLAGTYNVTAAENLVYVVASNIIAGDGGAVANAARSITVWFKLSSAPVLAKTKVVITNPSVDAVVTVSNDTLYADPVSDFKYDDNPTVTVTGEAVSGDFINFNKSFTVLPKPQMTVVASNVLNANFEGLANVAENVEMWYRMSRTPDAATVTATVNEGAGAENAVARVNGDTVFVKHVRNFDGGDQPIVHIQGLDNEGLAFSLNGDNSGWPDWAPFTVRQALYPVASNMWDVSDNVADNFPVYGVMWVKWSGALSTDPARITWANGAAVRDLYGDATAGQPNATVRIAGDTLYVTPIASRIALNSNDNVGFNVTVTGDQGTQSLATNFQVNYVRSNLYVSATNTVDPVGVRIDTFGVLQTAWLLSSLPVQRVTGVNNLSNISAANQNLAACVRLSGDTIFFTPVEALVRGTLYAISFDVNLQSGLSSVGNELSMTWKVKDPTPLTVKATNTLHLGVMVDTFDLLQPVWIMPSAPVRTVDAVKYYSGASVDVNGSGANLSITRTRLSAAGDTIFYTPVDTLDLGTQYGVEFEVTLTTGEAFTANQLTAVWKTKAAETVTVTSTNTRAADGSVIDTFGLQGRVWVVSSTPFTSVDKVNNYDGPGAYAPVPGAMQVLSNVRVSGDTIFFTPSYNLGAGAQYSISFDVTLPSGQKATSDELFALWETQSGVKVVSANDMNAAFNQYRLFKNRGDSLVVTFSQAIDTSEPFSVANYGSAVKLTYRWSADLKTVTIKDTSTLAAVKPFAVTPDYSLTATAEYTNLSFSLTTQAGEVQAALAPNTDFSGIRPPLKIHTEMELVGVDANFLSIHDAAAVAAANSVIDTFLPAQSITVTFNRAIDTTAVKAAARDVFFSLYHSTATTVPLDYAISFSTDGRTVTLNPVVDLVPGGTYKVKVVNVRDAATNDLYSGPAAGSYLTTANFTVQPATSPVKSIAALASIIASDTNTTADVEGKRIGASPVASATGVYRNALLNLETALHFRLQESAWNAGHNDSVDAYQWRIRAVSGAGVPGSWYETAPAWNISTATWSTAWNAGTVNAANAAKAVTVNPSTAQTLLGGTIISYLRTDLNSMSGYSNADHIFNDSARIEIQVRAVLDTNSDGNFTSAGEFGAWSNTVAFADNIAPCDSDFVLQANLTVLGQGGVNVAHSINWDNNDVGEVPLDSTSSWVTLTFPEDMDTGTAPTLTFARGTAVAIDYSIGSIPTAPSVAAGDGTNRTGWTSARSYTAYILLPAAEDYRATDGGNAQPWTGFALNVGVAGMKDASGVSITSWGSRGNTTTADLENGANGQDNGSVSLSGWLR